MFWFVVMTFVCGKDATVTLKKTAVLAADYLPNPRLLFRAECR